MLVFKVADWAAYGPRLSGLAPVLDRPDLALYRVPARPAEVRLPAPPVVPVVAADATDPPAPWVGDETAHTWTVEADSEAAAHEVDDAAPLSAGVRKLVSSGRYPQGGRR